MWWHKFVACQIRLWHGLVALAVCLGIVLVITLPSNSPELIDRVSRLELDIAGLEAQQGRTEAYIQRQIWELEMLEETTKMEISELELVLASPTHPAPYHYTSKSEVEQELMTLRARLYVTRGRISAYEDIRDEF